MTKWFPKLIMLIYAWNSCIIDRGRGGGATRLVHSFFYKNKLYKNIEARIWSKNKNNVRTC